MLTNASNIPAGLTTAQKTTWEAGVTRCKREQASTYIVLSVSALNVFAVGMRIDSVSYMPTAPDMDIIVPR